MKRYFLPGLFLLLGVVAAQPQSIQYKPNFTITVNGGYQFGGSVDETYKVDGVDYHGESIGRGESLGIEGSEMLGVTFDYRLGPKLLLEFSFDRQNTNLSFRDTSSTSFVKLSDMHVDTYQAGLIYNWGSGDTQPFVGGTVGLTSMIPTEGLSSVRRFSAAPVFGVKVFTSKHFGLCFQTRLLVTNMPKGQDYFTNSSGAGYNHTLNSYMTQLHFTLGIILGL